MPKVTVCAIPRVKIGPPRAYGGGNVYPGARAISHYATISRAEAVKLTTSVFGSKRLPRMGHEMLICNSTWLENTSGRFVISRRGDGEFKGTRRKRRR